MMEEMALRSPYASVLEAIEEIKKGKILILVDDEDRENEGDLYFPAEKTTPEAINFMAKYGRGLICLSLEASWIEKLQLAMMSPKNQSRFQTNFTVSIEAREGITTGISAFDRAKTILTAIDSKVKPEDLVSPGHIFPLKAMAGGVLRRAGQTEASVDLSRIAGLHPSGVICEIMSENGAMARGEDLIQFANTHKLKILMIKDLIDYRLKRDSFVVKVDSAKLPTRWGDFEIQGFKNLLNDENYVALTKGTWTEDEPVLVRVHSECLTGDVFGSKRCDCQAQLLQSMQMIEQEKKGVILYLPQEGRGIGILNKIKAYHLQDQGQDTVQANQSLGFPPDLRDYGFGAQVLFQLGLRRLRLITNNPQKVIALKGYHLIIEERVPIITPSTPENSAYLETKKQKMGHFLGNS